MSIYKTQFFDGGEGRTWERQIFLLARAAKRVSDMHCALRDPDCGLALDLEPTQEKMQFAIQRLNQAIIETDVFMSGYIQRRNEESSQ